MGVLLSTPITEKETIAGENNRVNYAASAMQGWRTQMEDAHIVAPDIAPEISLFGVYDGHGGMEVSQFISRHLIQLLLENENFKKKNYSGALKEVYLKLDVLLQTREGKLELYQIVQQKNATKSPNSNGSPFEMIEALSRSAREKEISSKLQSSAENGNAISDEEIEMIRYGIGSGSTAVTALIVTPPYQSDSKATLGEIYVANAGDSRTVLSRAGKAIELSHDHKPYDTIEYQRIIKAGGSVDGGRVKGDLNLSRAIGDLQYKQTKNLSPEEQMITCDPDISVTPITPEDELLIIGCDGIWDVKTSQQAVDFATSKLKEGLSPTEICHQILTDCVAPSPGGAGTDNMTIQIIVIKQQKQN